jgi:outer membrane protein OmpA-like peptidoglycan-associated protein
VINTKRRYVVCTLAGIILAGCASTSGNGKGADTDSAKRNAVKVSQTARGAQITSDDRILFDTGKADVKQEGMVFIERVAKILKEKTKANVAIEGYTDNVGAAALNQTLSERRAASVKQALVAKGVPSARIAATGFGMNKPVGDNNTSEGRQANRRTNIIVLGESVENIGGSSLGDQLSEGLGEFLKNAGEVMSKVFGSDSKN